METDMFSLTKKNLLLKIIGAGAGIVFGILIAYIPAPEGLSPEAMRGLGVITWAIIFWIFNVLPEYVVALLMCSGWVLFGVAPFNVAFSQFSNPNWWLLIGALGIGVALNISGLLKRAAKIVMRIFPATYKGQVLGLLLSSIVIAPAIPSVVAKTAIISPLSLQMSEIMGIRPKSSGAAGLFAAMYAGCVSSAPIFLSASFLCYIARGFLPPEYQAQFSWTFWFVCALPWAVIFIIGSYFSILLIYRSSESEIEGWRSKNQFESTEKMSRQEKATLAVILVTLLMWMTEHIHNISATLVALLSLCVLLGLKVFDRTEFSTSLPWASIIFIGAILNLGAMVPYLGLDIWIGNILQPLITHLLKHPYLFIVIFAAVIYLVRLVMVSMVATLTIFMLLLVPLSTQADINPWIMGFILLASVNIWVVYYQNSNFLIAHYATGGKMIDHSQTIPMSLAYMVISLIGLLASVPYWKLLNLF
jgi:DASS family divalent anion:Na+ symporter